MNAVERISPIALFLEEMAEHAVLLVVPRESLITVRDEHLECTLGYLQLMLDRWDLGCLMQISLDRYPLSEQAVYGSLKRWEELPDYYAIHAAVPGPFPSTMITKEKEIIFFRSQPEACVWIIAHELCHYLKHTNQLDGPNDERSAIDFAHAAVREYMQDL